MNLKLCYLAIGFFLVSCETNVGTDENKLVSATSESDFNTSFRLGDDELMKRFETVLSENQIPHQVNTDGTISYYRRDKERVQVVLDEALQIYLQSKRSLIGEQAP